MFSLLNKIFSKVASKQQRGPINAEAFNAANHNSEEGGVHISLVTTQESTLIHLELKATLIAFL